MDRLLKEASEAALDMELEGNERWATVVESLVARVRDLQQENEVIGKIYCLGAGELGRLIYEGEGGILTPWARLRPAVRQKWEDHGHRLMWELLGRVLRRVIDEGKERAACRQSSIVA